jgi:hypothetical protein
MAGFSLMYTAPCQLNDAVFFSNMSVSHHCDLTQVSIFVRHIRLNDRGTRCLKCWTLTESENVLSNTWCQVIEYCRLSRELAHAWCICFLSLVKAVYFYMSYYWVYISRLGHYLLVKNSGSGSVVSAQFQPHFCFSVHTITSMKWHWIKFRIVHMFELHVFYLLGI